MQRAAHGRGDAREGTAGDTLVGSRWRRACLLGMSHVALCGRRPACIRAFSRPHGRRKAEKTSVQAGSQRWHRDLLRLRACTRALLTAVLVVQAVTYCATSSTIGDWEDTSVHCAQSFAGKRSTRCLRVNFRTYRSILDIALGQAPSQSISAAVCKLSCLCTTCPLHSPH